MAEQTKEMKNGKGNFKLPDLVAKLRKIGQSKRSYFLKDRSLVPMIRCIQACRGATGKAHLSKEKNGNPELKVVVCHLAKPGALTPSRQPFVVWTKARGKEAQNQGVLKVNDNLEATFENTVSNADFDIFITAQDNSKIDAPSERRLLKGTMQP